MEHEIKIDVNGVTIDLIDSGGSGTPIIFIHPFPFHKSYWEPQFEFFKKKYRVIIYDLRAFGRSTANKDKSSIGLFSDDLVALMDQLKIGKAIACGLSLGGYILLDVMERYNDRLKAVILCDTQCLADSKEGQQKRYDTIKEIEEKGITAFTEITLKNVLSDYTMKKNPTLVEKARKIILSNTPDAIASGLSAMAQRKETCSGLKEVSLPALIICGEDDDTTPLTQSEFLFNNIPGAQMHAIKNAGHLSSLEQPDVFNEHMHHFIENLIS